MEVKFKTFGCFSNPVSSYVNACNLEQDGPGHGSLEKRCLVRRKKVLLVVFLVVALFFGQKRVPGAKRSWRGSLVPGERRHLMKKVSFVPGVGSSLREGVFAWGFGVWRRKPGKSRCRRRILAPRTCQESGCLLGRVGEGVGQEKGDFGLQRSP